MTEYFLINKSDSIYKFEDLDVIDTIESGVSNITYTTDINTYSTNLHNTFFIRLFRLEEAYGINYDTKIKFTNNETNESITHLVAEDEFYNITDIINNNLINITVSFDNNLVYSKLEYHSALSDTNLRPYIVSVENLNWKIPDTYIKEPKKYNLDILYMDSNFSNTYNTTLDIEFNPRVITRSFDDYQENNNTKNILANPLYYRIYDKTNNVYLTPLLEVNYTEKTNYYITIQPNILYNNTLYTLEFNNLSTQWLGSKYNFNIK